jgi:ClpP class serine protease
MYLAIDSLMAEIRDFSFNSVTAELKTQHEEAKSQIEANSKLVGEPCAGIAVQQSERSRVLSVSGSNAEIMVSGVMVKNLSFMAWIMGATAYSEITSAADAIVADSDITDVQLRIDSGGGTVAGMMACLNSIKAIRDSGKRTTAIVDGVCGSAAYAIAAQCEKIVAITDGEIVGSVGAQTVAAKDPKEEVIVVRGENSKNKNADAFTESGYAVVKEQTDDFEDVYLSAVANGRGVSVDVVKATYGNGKIMSARKALECGMIDAIASQNGAVSADSVTNLSAQGETEHQPTANSEEIMNKAELQAKHPELYASLKAEFIAEGKQQEQERVSAFAEIGEASGAMDLAMACIKDGSEPSNALTMKFSAAAMRNQTLGAMADDNVDTEQVDQTKPEAKTFDDEIAEAMTEDRGEFY